MSDGAFTHPGADARQALIERLSEDLRPVARSKVTRRLLFGVLCGAAVSAILITLTLGLRADLAEAVAHRMFWVKAVYTVSLAAAALWACERLARPAGEGGGRLPWIGAPVLAVAALAAWRFALAAAPDRSPMTMGATADVCPWLIVAFSAPPLAGLVWALRGLAPTRLRLTGLTAGLAAGGAGAAAYGLHCPESGVPFLAIWYTLGVLLAGGAGALLGPRLLRW